MVVNNTATTTTTATNTATITYQSGSSTASKAATSPSFRILASTTLPGTGIMGPPVQQTPLDGPIRLAGVFSLLLTLAGIGAILFSRRARRNNPDWANWYLGTGLMLAGVAIVFGLAAWGMQIYSHRNGPVAGVPNGLPTPEGAQPGLPKIDQSLEDIWSPDMFLTATPEKLPDYPIPTPSVMPADGADGQTADTSPIEHIRIPAINVDNVVKYVPFDGLTWMIAGLREEIAWMGDTSWPGLGGNTSLAGHVTLSNGIGPFYELSKLQPGDSIELRTAEKIYIYQVRAQQVVAETDVSVIQSTSATQLTLITCTGWDEASRLYLKRLIVTADLIETRPLLEQTAYR
jgi:LPXTG-site transpeptidase (sortase) family protein